MSQDLRNAKKREPSEILLGLRLGAVRDFLDVYSLDF